MVGDGPLGDDCRSLAHRLGCPVELTGALTGRATLEVIAASRCLCLPARRDDRGDQDGIPVVLMEAMALGTPVVTTAVSGIPELVRPTAGWLVDDRALDVVGDLARALHECLSAPDVAAARSRVARGIVAGEFTLRAQALGVAAIAATPPLAVSAR
jgi:glycosyltransferase involved in cell wall biosynthesis